MARKPVVLRMRFDLAAPLLKPSPPQGIRIRTQNAANSKDAKAAHAVLEAGYYEGGGGAAKFGKWWRELKRDKEFDPALCFLAEENARIVGLCQCWTIGFVKDVAVIPSARRRGIARALILTAFAAFAARGAAHVDLKVFEKNAAAQRLYESLGMSVVAREDA